MPSFPINPPDPEVSQKFVRRHFTVEYKLSNLRQAEACRDEWGIGALLRKEGLYSPHLIGGAGGIRGGILSGLKPKPRVQKANPIHRL